MANNLANKFINAEDLSSILSHLVTKVNDKINTKPKIEIADTGEFVINDKNTGVKAKGENGNTTIKLDIDSSNNVIATMNDNTTINIGNLNPTVSPDMVSENGLGNVRYYNGKFQYKNNNTWIDIVSTSDNKIYQSLMPKPLEHFIVQYDESLNKNILTLTPPSDTIIDNQTICFVEKVIIRRKKDSVPESITDGENVMTLMRKDFNKNQKTDYIDESFVGTTNEVWYYRAFVVNDLGMVNSDTIKIVRIKSVIYGFRIDQNESDPDSMITYIEDNVGFKPAHMDYGTNTFDYGDWENVWFIKKLKPCMLRYDGTVDYELDKNDYSKKADGSGDSDISNINYEGNAMIGMPKVYYKIVDNGDDTVNVYFSNKKVDDDYHCYAHIDENGNEIDYCYMAIYNGYVDSNNKLRSISDKLPTGNLIPKTFSEYAQANDSSSHIWQTDLWCDRTLVTLLLMLISKTTDSQTAFGEGITNSSTSFSQGYLNKNGLFYGFSSSQPVKVFGIENYWGNYRRVTMGFMIYNNNAKVKMTYDMSDGSTVVGYNLSGNGYVEVCPVNNYGYNYISKQKYSKYGLISSSYNGSATTYYCDFFGTLTSNGTYYCLTGGSRSENNAKGVGIFYNNTSNGVSWTNDSVNATLSCKPLATTTSTS